MVMTLKPEKQQRKEMEVGYLKWLIKLQDKKSRHDLPKSEMKEGTLIQNLKIKTIIRIH